MNFLVFSKGLFTNFEWIKFFRVSPKETFLYKRSTSIKQLRLEIIEKIGWIKSELFYRDGTLITNVSWDTRKMLYIGTYSSSWTITECHSKFSKILSTFSHICIQYTLLVCRNQFWLNSSFVTHLSFYIYHRCLKILFSRNIIQKFQKHFPLLFT